MENAASPFGIGPESEHDGCAYPVEVESNHRRCGAPRRPGSPYCPNHHALCYVATGTIEESKRLREVEVLADAVGGRRGRAAREPSRHFLRRLEHRVGDFSHVERS